MHKKYIRVTASPNLSERFRRETIAKKLSGFFRLSFLHAGCLVTRVVIILSSHINQIVRLCGFIYPKRTSIKISRSRAGMCIRTRSNLVPLSGQRSKRTNKPRPQYWQTEGLNPVLYTTTIIQRRIKCHNTLSPVAYRHVKMKPIAPNIRKQEL